MADLGATLRQVGSRSYLESGRDRIKDTIRI